MQQLLRQLLDTLLTLLKMPRSVQSILTKLEDGKFVINIGGDIGIGATALRRHERGNNNTAFPVALTLMFVTALAGAFFFDDLAHDHILAIISLVLGAILGIRLFFRW